MAGNDLLLGEVLGEGGQATVVKGQWNGLDVAVKQPKVPRAGSNKKLTNSTAHLDSFAQAVRREARALHRVRHPNVVKLHGLCFEPSACPLDPPPSRPLWLLRCPQPELAARLAPRPQHQWC